MRFRSIKFENYRCFINGEIVFEEIGNKNITLLIGPNGGGKTETLFAFWWTLYDFDFSKLRGKEHTPYALNADQYRELESAQKHTQKSCSVTIKFEYENKIYEIKKTCVYTKQDKKIETDTYQELSYYKANSELSLPIRDLEEIKKALNRIIPSSILHGIIFDGERMLKLSSSEDGASSAIKGVINDITNNELLEKTSENFNSVMKQLNKEVKKCPTNSNNVKPYEIVKELTNKQEEEKKLKDDIEKLEKEKNEIIERCNIISDLLENNNEVKKIESSRKIARDELAKAEDRLTGYYKDFSAHLKNGYLLTTDSIMNDVEQIIKEYDIPKGLTVPAVKSILERTHCICGREINEEARKMMENLILSLPPDNINSTLSEIINQTRYQIKIEKYDLKQTYNYIKDTKKEIADYRDTLASYSSQINVLLEGQDNEEIAFLEKENIDKQKQLGVIEDNIPKMQNQLKQLQKNINELIEKRDNALESEALGNRLRRQMQFVEKCSYALGKISDHNKYTALNTINEKLENAYELLSEDAVLGKKIHIVEYDNKLQYSLVVYIEKNFKAKIETWKQLGVYDGMLQADLSEEEIKERAILECLDSSSTGQSKMNTLSFVKAILDYSNMKKGEDSIELTKEYPLLIDAPFGDLSGQNLIQAASELHNFSGQVILMLDNDKYKDLEQYIRPYVSQVYEFNKTLSKTRSTIRKC